MTPDLREQGGAAEAGVERGTGGWSVYLLGELAAVDLGVDGFHVRAGFGEDKAAVLAARQAKTDGSEAIPACWMTFTKGVGR